ncbi:MAG TPA: hypothetical protein VGC41_15710 [Kofleriaceae bacterium]
MAKIDPDVEARAREITRVAAAGRKPLPPELWVISAAVSFVCCVAFAIAWFRDSGTQSTQPIPGHPHPSEHHGLSPFGLVIAGAIATVSIVIARRNRGTARAFGSTTDDDSRN